MAGSLRAQGEQELARAVTDRLLRPLGGDPRAAAEVLERQRPDHAEVVVAREADRAVPSGELDARVGLGAVAHEVPKAPDLVDGARLGVGEDGLEGGPVA